MLHDRINRRVVQMLEQGLEAETRRLLDLPRPLSATAAQAVGYREVIDWLDGRTTRDEAIRRIQARTRQFAKRQETWFRGLAEVVPIEVSPDDTTPSVADRLLDRMRLA